MLDYLKHSNCMKFFLPLFYSNLERFLQLKFLLNENFLLNS